MTVSVLLGPVSEIGNRQKILSPSDPVGYARALEICTDIHPVTVQGRVASVDLESRVVWGSPRILQVSDLFQGPHVTNEVCNHIWGVSGPWSVCGSRVRRPRVPQGVHEQWAGSSCLKSWV